jgi:hypothetical protein
MLMDAIRDGQDLVRWAEPNTIALEDEWVEYAVLAALGTPTPPDSTGVPMLRSCDPERTAVPLLDVVVSDRREYRKFCDRCPSNGQPNHRLWIPSGASVAELVCCWHCRRVLDYEFSGLVWR